MRYAHTNLVARDWEALAQFYTAVFTCRIVPPVRDQSGDWLSRGTGVPNAALKGAHLLLPGHGDHTTIGTESPHLQEWVDRGW